MKKLFYLILMLLMVTSCAYTSKAPMVKSEKVEIESSSAPSMYTTKPVPTPTKLYQPTIQEQVEAQAFLTSKELIGFKVSNPPDTFTFGKQSESERIYYSCLGKNAPKLAIQKTEGQLAGDHYWKAFEPNMAAITSSSYFPTKETEGYIEYIKNDKTHKKCFIEFMIRFKGNASNVSNISYTVDSDSDGVLIVLLSSPDGPSKPGLYFYTFYTVTPKGLLQYTVNIMGYNTPDRAVLGLKMKELLKSIIVEKRKIVS